MDLLRLPRGEEAFGTCDPKKLLHFNRSKFAKSEPISQGMTVGLEDATGKEFVGRVDSFTDTDVTLDLNHPLAGQRLKFDIQLQEVI